MQEKLDTNGRLGTPFLVLHRREVGPMDHSEAVEQMATERYLLDEMTPELREAFEEHLFDCPECALDLRTGAAFVDEAKKQLPQLTTQAATPIAPALARPSARKRNWFAWLQPAFAVPAFALLLLFVGYQNFATIPALRLAASQPRLLPWVSFHAGTRGAAKIPVLADPKQGAVLVIDLPQNLTFTSYAFDLYDPQGKRFWSQTIAAPKGSRVGEKSNSLLIPGSGLQQGSYTLAISGVGSDGGRTEIDRHVFDIHFDE